MKQLESSTPHFIRCIKPNSKKIPGLYEKDLVLEQLRCCGVLEIVRISRSGYPTRVTHQEFAKRWSMILWYSYRKKLTFWVPGNNVFEWILGMVSYFRRTMEVKIHWAHQFLFYSNLTSSLICTKLVIQNYILEQDRWVRTSFGGFVRFPCLRCYCIIIFWLLI